MTPPISIVLSSNERNSDRATSLARVVASDPAYVLKGFAEIPIDMQLTRTEERGGLRYAFGNVNIELKEIPDFWSSKASGHLGTQILQMISEGVPGFVAVFGSLQEVMAQVPKVKSVEGRVKKRTGLDIASDINTVRALCADAVAANVPVFFLSSNYEMSFRYILSYAKNILQGPSLSSWLPRFVDGVNPSGYGMLVSIKGIGHEAACGLLRAYGGVEQIVNEAKFNPRGLAETLINGKRLGPAKASAIRRAVGA